MKEFQRDILVSSIQFPTLLKKNQPITKAILQDLSVKIADDEFPVICFSPRVMYNNTYKLKKKVNLIDFRQWHK
jgi:hypothetical protein